MNTIESAAIFCNVPFGSMVGADALRHAILHADIPVEMLPYIERLMNEAPIAMLDQILNEFPQEERGAVISNFSTIADRVGATDRIAKWMTCG